MRMLEPVPSFDPVRFIADIREAGGGLCTSRHPDCAIFQSWDSHARPDQLLSDRMQRAWLKSRPARRADPEWKRKVCDALRAERPAVVGYAPATLTTALETAALQGAVSSTNGHRRTAMDTREHSNIDVPFNAERQPVVTILDGEAMADSRDVAAFFGKKNQHVHEAIRNLIAKDTDWGARNFRPNYIKDLTGVSVSHFTMTRDGFTILAMGFTGDKALQWKLRYIDAFKAMEAELRNRPAVDPIALLNDPVAMRGLLLNYGERVLALEADKAAMAPKVEALERIAEADGSLCITDAAKNLQVRPSDLFRFLRSHSWIYKRPGTDHDVAYQGKLVSGLLEHKTTTVHRSDGSEKITTQVRVTPKGLARLAQELPPAVRAA